MRRFALASCLIVPSVVVALCAAPATAQHFHAEGGAFIVNSDSSFSQEYGRGAVNFHADRMAVTWETVLNHEVMVRVYDGDGVPLTGDIQANDTLVTGRQDEPTIVMNDEGTFIVAWTDNAGFDGDGQGVFARIFDKDGVPVTAEFQVNVESNQSQWEPLVAATPDGNFVVAWSGRNNGDAFFRTFDPTGTPLTGDIQCNTLTNNAQIDISLGVASDNRLMAAWVDFGGNGTGGGQAVFGRRFLTDGLPLDFQEEQLHDTFNSGDQREPRVVSDRRFDRFIVAWHDNAADGSGFAIMARVFDKTGTPLSGEFMVNQTITGDQKEIGLASDWLGNFIVTWEDHSGAFSRIMARRYDRHGVALGDEVEIASSTVGDLRLPHIAMDKAGEDILFTWTGPYEGPGCGCSTPASDIWAQRWSFEPIIEASPPAIGTWFDMDIELPSGDTDDYYFLIMSFATMPGINLPDGRELPLFEDVLFTLTLYPQVFDPGGTLMQGYQGFLSGTGHSTASMALPNNFGFVGIEVNAALLVLDTAEFGLEFQLRHVTDAKKITIEL